jgi:hypothetical protein
LASGLSRKSLKLAETSAKGSPQDVKTMAAFWEFSSLPRP